MGKRDCGHRAIIAPLPAKGFQNNGHRFLGKMRMIVGLAEVRQDHMLETIVKDIA